jgi:hypothetical protein
LFEEGRGGGAAGIGLSTGFLKAAESVKTLLYRVRRRHAAIRLDIFA